MQVTVALFIFKMQVTVALLDFLPHKTTKPKTSKLLEKHVSSSSVCLSTLITKGCSAFLKKILQDFNPLNIMWDPQRRRGEGRTKGWQPKIENNNTCLLELLEALRIRNFSKKKFQFQGAKPIFAKHIRNSSKFENLFKQKQQDVDEDIIMQFSERKTLIAENLHLKKEAEILQERIKTFEEDLLKNNMALHEVLSVKQKEPQYEDAGVQIREAAVTKFNIAKKNINAIPKTATGKINIKSLELLCSQHLKNWPNNNKKQKKN